LLHLSYLSHRYAWHGQDGQCASGRVGAAHTAVPIRPVLILFLVLVVVNVLALCVFVILIVLVLVRVIVFIVVLFIVVVLLLLSGPIRVH
jgi:hypothetical protein